MIVDFIRAMKNYQYEHKMTNEMFAKYIGKSRAWLQMLYSANPSVYKSTLTELTMYVINQKTQISQDIMHKYNEDILSKRGKK